MGADFINASFTTCCDSASLWHPQSAQSLAKFGPRRAQFGHACPRIRRISATFWSSARRLRRLRPGRRGWAAAPFFRAGERGGGGGRARPHARTWRRAFASRPTSPPARCNAAAASVDYARDERPPRPLCSFLGAAQLGPLPPPLLLFPFPWPRNTAMDRRHAPAPPPWRRHAFGMVIVQGASGGFVRSPCQERPSMGRCPPSSGRRRSSSVWPA